MTTISVPDQTVSGSVSSFLLPPPPPTPPPASNVGSQISAYTFRTMALREVRDYTQHLAGRIKTIVDAAIPDPKQNKAVKDLIHDAIWTEHYSAVRAWAEIAAERHATPTDEAAQCIPAFPFATDGPLPVSI